MLLGLLGVTALVAIPAGLGLSLVADPLVRLAFGPKWLEAIPVVQIGGVGAGLACLGTVCAPVFGVQGWMKAGFKLALAITVPQILLLFVLVPGFGIVGAALAGILPSVAGALMNLGVATHRLRIGPIAILKDVWRSIAGSAIMAVVLVRLGLGGTRGPAGPEILASRLAEAVSIGLIVYLVTVLGLWSVSGRPGGPETNMLKLLRQRSPAVPSCTDV